MGNKISCCTETKPADIAELLFEKLGGIANIRIIMDSFWNKLIHDKRINFYWKGKNMDSHKKSLTDYFCSVFGGPAGN